MDPQRWSKVKQIFSEIVDLDAARRQTRLSEILNGDTELKAEVLALLDANEQVEDFIEEPALSNICLPTPSLTRVGHYRIVRELGRGGMGTVFLGERDDGEFEHEVAIKVVNSIFATPDSLRLFRRERQILAELDHPNIARMLDGGVTEDGLPYLVMEHVEGTSLTQWVNDHGLRIEQRLRLFLRVCAAVAYAHTNLVVHRDIKPTNILVTSAGEPKLLDFGLAKILDIDLDGARTTTNLRALTPEYASPEQIRGDALTTATDVYSLGIVLYELLTGERPFSYRSMSLNEMLRNAATRQPDKPSSRVSVGDAAVKVDRRLNSRNVLQGDLDNIVLKALKNEPERRYLSVGLFADDIERHLNGLPVSATTDTFIYRASKFVKRNAIAVAATASIAALLLIGIVVTTWQARIVGHERDRAQLEKQNAEALNTFLQSILSVAAPEKMGKDAKVVDVLKDASARIETDLSGQPELRARALATIGDTYIRLGLVDEAAVKLREAVAAYADLYPNGSDDRTRAEKLLAECLVLDFSFEEASAIMSRVIAAERGRGPSAADALAASLFLEGELRLRQGSYADAETSLIEAIALCEHSTTIDSFECVYYKVALGRAKQFAGDLDSAAPIFRDAVSRFESDPRRAATRLGDTYVNLGDVLLTKGDTSGALELFSKGDEIYRRETSNSYQVAITQYYLARAYLALKDNARASEFAGNSIEIARRLDWVNNRNYIGALAVKGRSMLEMGRPREAEPYLQEALERGRKNLAPADPKLTQIEIALDECRGERHRG